MLRGWYTLNQNRPVEALQDFDICLYFSSNQAHVQICSQARRIAQRMISYNVRLEEDDECLIDRGICHRMMKNTEAALLDFESALKLNPWSQTAKYHLEITKQVLSSQ
jgi:hypothetical protein